MTATQGMLVRAACTPNTTYQVRVNQGASPGATVDHALFGDAPVARVVDDGGIVVVRVYY